MNYIYPVTLEFLRHGPAHNQLLSPLTRYLALCNSHQAMSVEMPWEHNELAQRLEVLRYLGETPQLVRQREQTIKEMSQRITGILSQIPGLVAELAEAFPSSQSPAKSDKHHPERSSAIPTHLEFVLSASELALIPFEFTLSPNGCPGTGQSLLLQPDLPICLTRRVRRVDGRQHSWNRQPNILFVWAAPGGAALPLETHVQALADAVAPWIQNDQSKSETESHRGWLTILGNATLADIEQKCQSNSFTHVHILAHGGECKDGQDDRFGICLHDPDDSSKMDIVSGSRLATALRSFQNNTFFERSSPLAVTLASCDSGNVGSVLGSGASVAHALHAGGIPLVVASQFPLTFLGSEIMVRTLYQGILDGDDPRQSICRLRSELFSRLPTSHDWASIVAYAALPMELPQQLQALQISQARKRVTAAFKAYDAYRVKHRQSCAVSGGAGATTPKVADQQELQTIGQEIVGRMEKTYEKVKWLDESCRQSDSEVSAATAAQVLGLIAAGHKRLAEVRFHLAPNVWDNDPENEIFKLLRESQERYRLVFEKDHSNAWGLTQSLVLNTVLDGAEELDADAWNLARLLSTHHVESSDQEMDRTTQAYGYGNLLELYLVAVLKPDRVSLTPDQAADRAEHYADKLRHLCKPDSEPIRSARISVQHYHWFAKAFPKFHNDKLTAACERVVEALGFKGDWPNKKDPAPDPQASSKPKTALEKPEPKTRNKKR